MRTKIYLQSKNVSKNYILVSKACGCRKTVYNAEGLVM